MECLFCKILSGAISADIIYQDDRSVAIRDIYPQAPNHILILPREHIVSLAEATKEQLQTVEHLVEVAWQLARNEKITKTGFRLVTNSGPDGDQVIPHLHFHLLGGRKLSGQMG
ncbi:MAG: histidine triad nucleotide-binding protein [Dehalococcoidia bacterium]|nr:histidine triad nucleotide-binding protein [Dehalococcoidia bacterium]